MSVTVNVQAIGELLDRWVNDPVFRAELRRDPVGAVRRAGVDLDPEEWEALAKVDWSLTDHELETRVSKGAI